MSDDGRLYALAAAATVAAVAVARASFAGSSAVRLSSSSLSSSVLPASAEPVGMPYLRLHTWLTERALETSFPTVKGSLYGFAGDPKVGFEVLVSTWVDKSPPPFGAEILRTYVISKAVGERATLLSGSDGSSLAWTPVFIEIVEAITYLVADAYGFNPFRFKVGDKVKKTEWKLSSQKSNVWTITSRKVEFNGEQAGQPVYILERPTVRLSRGVAVGNDALVLLGSKAVRLADPRLSRSAASSDPLANGKLYNEIVSWLTQAYQVFENHERQTRGGRRLSAFVPLREERYRSDGLSNLRPWPAFVTRAALEPWFISIEESTRFYVMKGATNVGGPWWWPSIDDAIGDMASLILEDLSIRVFKFDRGQRVLLSTSDPNDRPYTITRRFTSIDGEPRYTLEGLEWTIYDESTIRAVGSKAVRLADPRLAAIAPRIDRASLYLQLKEWIKRRMDIARAKKEFTTAKPFVLGKQYLIAANEGDIPPVGDSAVMSPWQVRYSIVGDEVMYSGVIASLPFAIPVEAFIADGILEELNLSPFAFAKGDRVKIVYSDKVRKRMTSPTQKKLMGPMTIEYRTVRFTDGEPIYRLHGISGVMYPEKDLVRA